MNRANSPVNLKIFASGSIFSFSHVTQLYCLRYESANSSLNEIVQQKSSIYRINNMARQPILIFDFEKPPFDGDSRQAHQFIPFLLGKLGAAQLSYILNSQQYPDPEIPEYALLKEREHSILQDLAATEYKQEMETYSHFMLVREVELSNIRRTVQDPDDRARQLAAKPPVPLPKLRDVPLLGITSGDLS